MQVVDILFPLFLSTVRITTTMAQNPSITINSNENVSKDGNSSSSNSLEFDEEGREMPILEQKWRSSQTDPLGAGNETLYGYLGEDIYAQHNSTSYPFAERRTRGVNSPRQYHPSTSILALGSKISPSNRPAAWNSSLGRPNNTHSQRSDKFSTMQPTQRHLMPLRPPVPIEDYDSTTITSTPPPPYESNWPSMSTPTYSAALNGYQNNDTVISGRSSEVVDIRDPFLAKAGLSTQAIDSHIVDNHLNSEKTFVRHKVSGRGTWQIILFFFGVAMLQFVCNVLFVLFYWSAHSATFTAL